MALMKNFGLAGISSDTQWGKGGGRIKWTTDRFEVLDKAGAAVQFRIATTPVAATDAASKAYVDSVAAGLDPKASVRAATTADLGGTYANGTAGVGATITLGGNIGVIDGVTLTNGDRLLVKNQTNPAHNGIYVLTSATVLTRASDMDGSPAQEVDGGEYVFVEEGDDNADSGFVNSSDYGGAATIGTDPIEFVQFSGAGQIDAGDGLTKTGNVLNVVGTTSRISVSADAIDIDAGYVGQTSITTLGTITTGTWTGTTIATANGGTGLTAIGAAKTVLRTNAAGNALEYASLTAGDVAVVLDPTNYTETGATLEGHLAGIDAALAGAGGELGELQAELDNTQAKLGLDVDGNLVAWTGTHAIDGTTTFAAAIEALDAAAAALAGDITAEETRATAAEEALGDRIDTASDDLAAEVTRATGIEAGLQTELDATQAGAGLAADGAYAPDAGANYIAAATSLKNADTLLDTAVKAMDTAYKAADTALGSRIDALGNAFNYVGTLPAQDGIDGAGTEAEPYVLDGMDPGTKDAGDYYKITTAGFYKFGAGAAIEYFVNDGLVFNNAGGIDNIANTNATVDGTAGSVVVTGAIETGFVVDIDPAFKALVSTAGTDIDALEGRATAIEAKNVEQDGRLDDLEAGTTDGLADLQTEIDAIETAVGLGTDGTLGTLTGTYVGSSTSIKGAIVALDGALVAADTAYKAADTAIQAELDATQAGAGLGTDGAYTANGTANYIQAATSLKDADDRLDAAIKAADGAYKDADTAIKGELDTTQTGAGLEADGTYLVNGTANYIQAATSLKDADNRLDAAVKAIDTAYKAADEAMDARIDALGNAFNYVGVLEDFGDDEPGAFDLDTLPANEKDPGDYFKVTAPGWFKYTDADDNVVTKHANLNDGIVKNVDGGWDIIDNTNSSVTGTPDYIRVDGSTETGYTVDIADAFIGRVEALEAATGSGGALQTEVDKIEAAIGLEADGDLVPFTGTNYLNSATTIAGALTALDTALDTAADGLAAEITRATGIEGGLQTELNATQAAAGLGTDGAYVVPTGTTYLGSTTTLASADIALDAAIKEVADDLAGLSQSRIQDDTGNNTYVDTKVANNLEQIHFGVNGDIIAKMIEGASGTDESFTFTKATGEVRIEAHNVAGTGDIDIRLVPQGSGQVFIGETGDGVVQADNNSDLTLAGGDGATAGDLILRGGEGAANGIVNIKAAGKDVMHFVGAAAATSYFVATNDPTAGGDLVLGAAGADADIDLVLSPKGDGFILAPTGYSLDGAPAEALVTKQYVDTSLATAAVGGIREVHVAFTSGTLTAGGLAIGAPITGRVMRVRVAIDTALDGAVTVGRTGGVAELAAADMIDETATGMYIIDVNQNYTTATQLVIAGTATAGAGFVIIEYASAAAA